MHDQLAAVNADRRCRGRNRDIVTDAEPAPISGSPTFVEHHVPVEAVGHPVSRVWQVVPHANTRQAGSLQRFAQAYVCLGHRIAQSRDVQSFGVRNRDAEQRERVARCGADAVCDDVVPRTRDGASHPSGNERLKRRCVHLPAARYGGQALSRFEGGHAAASLMSQITPPPTITTPVIMFCLYQVSSLVQSVRGERVPYK